MKFISALLACVLLAAPAMAQDKYPSQRLNWIIAFGPGGGNDIMARTLISILEKYKLYPGNIVAENRAGGPCSTRKATPTTSPPPAAASSPRRCKPARPGSPPASRR